MKTNYFYDLPDDLQLEIYKQLHKKNLKETNDCIKNLFFDYNYGEMGMEVGGWYLFALIWAARGFISSVI